MVDATGRPVLPRLASAGLVAGVLGLSLLRAATQSLTHDEAFTFNVFASGGLETILGRYTPNNHVLHSILVWAATSSLGVSELTLRLPALLGASMVVTSSLALARRLVGRGWLAILGGGVLILNPLVLDYLAQARGYGLALGFLLTAMLVLLRRGELDGAAPPTSRAALASVLLGLGVASNLAFVVPGAAVVAAGLLITASRVTRPGRAARVARHAAALVAPGAAVAAVIVAAPLRYAERWTFHFGAKSLGETADGLTHASLAHHDRYWLGLPQPPEPWLDAVAGVLLPVSVIGVAAAAAAGLVFGRRGGPRSREPAGALALIGGSLAIAVSLVWLLHLATDAPYPKERTGLYLVSLYSLSMLALVGTALTAPRLRRTVAAVTGVILVATNTVYLLQLEWTHFRSHRYDADTRSVFEALHEQARRRDDPDRPLRVYAHFLFEPTLNAYRTMHEADWMEKIRREPYRPERAYDFCVLSAPAVEATPGGEEALARYLEIIETYPLSRTLLCRPKEE